MLTYFPKYFTNRAIILYFLILVVVTLFFYSYTMIWLGFVLGILEIVCFFYFSNHLTKKWEQISSKSFIKKLFTTSLIIRLAWVVFSYFLYMHLTGTPFEPGTADAYGYHQTGLEIANLGLRNGYWGVFKAFSEVLGVSDSGYISYLGVVYFLFGDSLFIVRIIKAILSAFTCVLVFKLASRTFGESTGKMAAIFCMLMPNLIYYCGLHLKETEMLFLTVAFMERADYAIRSTKLSFSNIIWPVLLAGSLFFFRTVLGATALFAFITALIFSNKRVLKKGWKRAVLIIWVFVAISYFMGGRIATEVEGVWEKRTTSQQQSMEWRTQRKGGNQFAKYASASIFAPMILVIPFPTVVNIENQSNQQLLNGGYYVKNIMAFFAMLALLWVLKNRKWRDYSLIGTFTLGYLIVVALSAFAHSERFHMPALPFVLIIAAFGVSLSTNKTKKYYLFYLVFIFIAVVGWSWFKLAGRGFL